MNQTIDNIVLERVIGILHRHPYELSITITGILYRISGGPFSERKKLLRKAFNGVTFNQLYNDVVNNSNLPEIHLLSVISYLDTIRIMYNVDDLSKKVDQQQNDIKNLSDKVDNLTDKLTVLIDALTLIDQKVSEKIDK